jgi:hypothetical protein
VPVAPTARTAVTSSATNNFERSPHPPQRALAQAMTPAAASHSRGREIAQSLPNLSTFFPSRGDRTTPATAASRANAVSPRSQSRQMSQSFQHCIISPRP